MKTPDADLLVDPAAAAKLTDAEWVALHLPRFKQVAPRYKAYEEFLDDCLKEIRSRLAPLAMVSARAKNLCSVAEKMLRKRTLYQDPADPLPPDPLVRMTDLCGGRIIAETATEVESICRFIEQAFDIDGPNSDDASQRLKPTEFGYRSVHYIIMVDPEKLAKAGIKTPVPPKILKQAGDLFPLKAEIQVRTLLEHAWSDLGHDLLYKSDLQVPDSMKRRFAQVAAVLEGADRDFGRLIAAFRDYRASLGSYHARSKIEAEIERLRIVLGHAPDNMALALRAARLAVAVGRHEEAQAMLEGQPWSGCPEIKRMLGIVLTELNWDSPRSDGFRRGHNLLEECVATCPRDAEALLALAESEAQAGRPAQARDLFHLAAKADPTDPIVICRYLQFEIGAAGDESVLRLAEPIVRAGIDRARKQIEARVNLPGAWSALSLLLLVAREPFESLHALAQVIALCRTSRDDGKPPAHPCAAGRSLQLLQNAVERLRPVAKELEGFAWFERFLNLGILHLLGDPDVRKHLERVASKPPAAFVPGRPVLILSGACAPGLEESIGKFGKMLMKAAEGTPFNLVSGGTRAGISGLAGDLAAGSNGRTTAFGYLPLKSITGTLPDTDQTRFGQLHKSKGDDFTPLEPLQAWTDLLLAGINPKSVRLLCYAPGEIARAEISIALAFGARAGLVIDPGLPSDRTYDDKDWVTAHSFLPLPYDRETLRVFLALGQDPLDQKTKVKLEGAAKAAHEAYLASARPKDPSQQPWKELPDHLKESNLQQVAFWQDTLKKYHLVLSSLTDAEKADPKRPLLDMRATLGDTTIDTLAQLEHGRWNVERLAFGWRYAKQKDVTKRLSPYLIPWKDVPKDIQQYDIDAILELPKKFREAGMDVEVG